MSNGRGRRFQVGLALLLLWADKQVSAEDVFQLRALSVRTEQAVDAGKLALADSLLPGLLSYPLYPHVLAKRLEKSMDDSAVESFLNRFPESRPAVSLRKKYLESLGGRGLWQRFEVYFRETGSVSLECFHFRALAAAGRTDEAYAGASKLWLTGATTPPACDDLFGQWRKSAQFDRGWLWRRFGLALSRDNQALADSIEASLTLEEKPIARLWRTVHAEPWRVLRCEDWRTPSPLLGRVFAHGVIRLATDAPAQAQAVWNLHRARFGLDGESMRETDRRLALAMATGRSAEATAYLMELSAAADDAQTRAWRVRAALLRSDWPNALESLERLAPTERDQSIWRYWRGRVLEALGDDQAAQDSYRSAAQALDFHGMLAADRLGQAYAFTAGGPGFAADALAKLASSDELSAVQEFRALGRDGEARAEFLHVVRTRLSGQDLAAAAYLARSWEWLAVAISVSAKAGIRDDLQLRFPVGFREVVQSESARQRVDPSLVLAVIRRESAFDPLASSSAGARGLMQLLPSTAVVVARRLDDASPSERALFDPARNIRYGTAYFKSLLERFHDHPAVAAAAYNAGPNRAVRWLTHDQPLAADLWIESIPYQETRDYVQAVAVNMIAYQTQLGGKRRLSEFLPEIVPLERPQAPNSKIEPVSVCK